MGKKNSTKEQFAKRLTSVMLDKGFHSERAARSGVDVSVIAKHLRVSGEMARRYCEGNAMPGADRIRRLAEWLGVRSAWLQYGEGPKYASQAESGQDVDAEVIELAKRLNSLRQRDRKVVESILDAIEGTEGASKIRLKVVNK